MPCVEPGAGVCSKGCCVIKLAEPRSSELLAAETADAVKPPRTLHVPKGRWSWRVLLMALRAERRRNAKLIEMLAR